MKYFYTALLLSLFCINIALADKNPEEQLQEIVSTQNLMGMSAVAVHEGKVIYTGHFGLSNYAFQTQVSDHTMYRIASISKAVTAMAFMKLHEQGLAGLDDDISAILGFTIRNPHHPDISITPRMLLSHTSTLNDGNTYGSFLGATYDNPAPPHINQLIVPGGSFFSDNIWLNATPGDYFQYSNLAYGILASVIEKIADTRFDIYVKENILQPLGIEGSFNIHDIENYSNIAVLYRMSCGQWEAQADNFPNGLPDPVDYSGYAPGHNGLIFAPQGGLRISAADLAKIMITLMEKGTYDTTQLLEEETVALMHERQWLYNNSNGDNYFNLFNSWGLGLHLITNQQDGDIVIPGYSMKGHAGEAYGLISDMYYNNNPDFGIIFITNGSAGAFAYGWNSAFYEVEEQVFDVLYNGFISPAFTTYYNISINIEGMGTTQPSPGNYSLVADSILQLTAQAHEGWKFEHFSINGALIEAPTHQLQVTSHTEITAVFSEIISSGHHNIHESGAPKIFMKQPENQLMITSGTQNLSTSKFQLFTMHGTEVFSKTIHSEGKNNTLTFDLSFLSAGAYIAVIRTEKKEQFPRKIIVF